MEVVVLSEVSSPRYWLLISRLFLPSSLSKVTGSRSALHSIKWNYLSCALQCVNRLALSLQEEKEQ